MATKQSTSLTGFSSFCQRNDEEAARCSQPTLRGIADRILALFALFHTQQDATCGGLYARALLSNILPAGFAHGERVVLSI